MLENHKLSNRKFVLVGQSSSWAPATIVDLSISFREIGLTLVAVLSPDLTQEDQLMAQEKNIALPATIEELFYRDDISFVIDYSQDDEVYTQLLEHCSIDVEIISSSLARLLMPVVQSTVRRLTNYNTMIDEFRGKAAKYQGLFDNSVVGLYQTRIEDGMLIVGNRKLADIFHYDNYEQFLVEHNAVTNFVDPASRDKLFVLLYENGSVDDFEVQLKRKDGTPFWACMSAQLFPERGYLQGMILDIDRRRQYEMQNKLLTQRIFTIQEERKKKLAQDLHDELGQKLTTLQLGMGKLKQLISGQFPQQNGLCEKMMTEIEQIGISVRRISSNLIPDILERFGLVLAIEAYVQSFTDQHPETKVTFCSMGFKKRMPAEIEIVLYRVIQESLTNILKYAEAEKVEINLTCNCPNAILTIKDDGIGCDLATAIDLAIKEHGAIGLLGMRHRLESIGGKLHLQSTLGEGTLVRAQVRVQEDC